MIECPNPTCNIWLHSECIVKEMEAQIREEATGMRAKTNGTPETSLKVELDGKLMKLVCTGPHPDKVETWRTDIECPRCDERIQ
jgi:hypothetical protein